MMVPCHGRGGLLHMHVAALQQPSAVVVYDDGDDEDEIIGLPMDR